jgi:hypothetical protein
MSQPSFEKSPLSPTNPIRRSLPALFLIPLLILNFWMAQPKKAGADTKEQQDAKKASEQATQVARKTAEADKKAQEEKAKILKEIIVKEDPAGGTVFRDNYVRWVRHQDFFGIQGIEGDLGLQFHITSKKTKDGMTPTDTTMVVSIFSVGEAHKDNHDGVITVDGRPITIHNASGYHTDTPMGVTESKYRVEVIDFPFDYNDFVAIATGKSVKGNIAGIEFEVKDFHQAVFREMMVETFPPPAPMKTETKKKKKSAAAQ